MICPQSEEPLHQVNHRFQKWHLWALRTENRRRALQNIHCCSYPIHQQQLSLNQYTTHALNCYGNANQFLELHRLMKTKVLGLGSRWFRRLPNARQSMNLWLLILRYGGLVLPFLRLWWWDSWMLYLNQRNVDALQRSMNHQQGHSQAKHQLHSLRLLRQRYLLFLHLLTRCQEQKGWWNLQFHNSCNWNDCPYRGKRPDTSCLLWQHLWTLPGCCQNHRYDVRWFLYRFYRSVSLQTMAHYLQSRHLLALRELLLRYCPWQCLGRFPLNPPRGLILATNDLWSKHAQELELILNQLTHLCHIASRFGMVKSGQLARYVSLWWPEWNFQTCRFLPDLDWRW